MKIALIGWGSLIWDSRSMCEHIGKWQTGGPCLPIEFSRISKGRPPKGHRLTLVIDEKNEEKVPTCFTESRIFELNVAITALAYREGITKDVNIKNGIGYVERNKKADTKFKQSAVIQKWMENTDFDAAIWTALKSNFYEKRKKQFTVENATEYLKSLSDREEGDDDAREYIEKAPPEICTPLRRHLHKTNWLKV